MISNADFERIVARANLAPSVHNVQPTRWAYSGDTIRLFADLRTGLSVGDPQYADMALSCGAALEATLLALSDLGLGAKVSELWETPPDHNKPHLHPVADLTLQKGTPDPVSEWLEHRFTWRGAFETTSKTDWADDDAHFVTSAEGKDWIATQNDLASLSIMSGRPFRKELLSWMRLSEGHPRYSHDGLSRAALQMPKRDALLARWALGPLWPLLHVFGATKSMTSEAEKTKSAALIVCFDRPAEETRLTSGRAYLRLCLKAASRGLSGWPMAALTDHPETSSAVIKRFAIPAERRLIQVIRFGKPTGVRPPTARRPLEELIL